LLLLQWHLSQTLLATAAGGGFSMRLNQVSVCYNIVRVCVWVCGPQKTKTKPKKYFFSGAVWLRPLTNLEVPHGAGACTLELCRFIWCGEYRSAVKVSTCNTNPTILLSIAIWIVVLLGLVEKIDNNQTSDWW
jgi:hypothetical protein